MTAGNCSIRVVSDSSPLINLAIIGQLRLLERFFSTVWIPHAVWRECVTEASGKPGVKAIEEANFLKRRQPKNTSLIQLLQRELDIGESEALALAIEMHADWVLLEQQDARNIAAMYRLRTTGVLGILLRAKREGHIASVHECLDQLQREAGFWLSGDLRRQVLELADEAR
jgi:predicted nucleic acid-binding protein